MSRRQRNRQVLRRKAAAKRARRATRSAAVVVTGSLLTTAVQAAPAGAADDVTAALVADIQPGAGGDINRPVAFGDALLFGADDGVHGSELWISDGTTAGTHMVEDVVPGAAGSSPQYLTVVGDTAFFVVGATEAATLWATDGTAAGTRLVGDTNPVAGAYTVLNRLTPVGDTLFFTASDENFELELWKSDGEGVTQLSDDPDGYLAPFHMVDVGGTLFFDGRDEAHGRELWKSDGTAAGTELVVDLNPNYDVYGGLGSSPTSLTAFGDEVFFVAENDETHKRKLWRSDGTAGGTELVKDIGGADDQQPGDLLVVGTTLFLSADDGPHGRELWRSDGTSAGTQLVSDIDDGEGSSGPRDFYEMNGDLYFTADDGVHGRELWRSDGTDAGTVLVEDIRPGGADSNSDPYYLTDLGGTLFFGADDGVNGGALWRSDGTAAGTDLVADPSSATDGGRPFHLTPLGDALFFVVDDGVHGRELWRTSAVAEPPPVVNETRPSVTGTPRVGSALTGSPGTWSETGLTYSYEWLVAGTSAPAGTGSRFTVPASAAGKTVTLRVTATASGRSATATSVPTGRVALGTQRLVRRPTVTGRAKVGAILRAAPGATAPASTSRRFQWLRNGAPIRGATGSTYRMTRSDRTKRISVRVTYVRAGYRPLSATSAQTGRVTSRVAPWR